MSDWGLSQADAVFLLHKGQFCAVIFNTDSPSLGKTGVLETS
jgi:hypothetical protein